MLIQTTAPTGQIITTADAKASKSTSAKST